MKINGKYLGIVAAMCGLSAATVGLITNVAGLFFGPMAEEFGVLQGAASLTLTIANVCMAVGGLFTRRLTKAMPLRVLLVAGVVLLAGSSALTALAPSIAVVYAASAVKGFAAGHEHGHGLQRPGGGNLLSRDSGCCCWHGLACRSAAGCRAHGGVHASCHLAGALV